MDVTTKQYVDTALNLKASLASPALTGTPTAPTATAGTNTTQIATTAFVTTAINNSGGGSGSLVNWANITNKPSINVGTGDYSIAEGDSTTASGYASHAEGYNTTASGDSSHAEGNYTTAQRRS